MAQTCKRLFIFVGMFALLLSPLYAQTPSSESLQASENMSIGQEIKALFLAYGKIKKISGIDDPKQVVPILEGLNQDLDKLMILKEKFSPEKRKKLENQLGQIKKKTMAIGEKKGKEVSSQLDEISGSVLNLINVLMDFDDSK